jgi:hypothetical protein
VRLAYFRKRFSMRNKSSKDISEEKRVEPRATRFKNYRIEIKLVGVPIYQFKVNDVSVQGAGLLVNENSGFLKMIEVGQTVDANFISPQGSNPSGMYKVEIRHITPTDGGRYKGFRLVGLQIRERLTSS